MGGAGTGSGSAAWADRPSRPPSVLSDGLLIQLRAGDVGDFAELARQDGSGMVLSGADALDGVKAVRHHQMSQPFLIDRRRYAGNKRVRGNEPFSDFWLSEQRRLGAAAVLTDSGYIGEQDLSALRSVLAQTVAHLERTPVGSDSPAGGAWAVLPLHQRWLRDDLALLTAEINRYGVPVALVLEHARDPLGTKIAVEGLTHLLSSEVPMALLSTDASALGALAFGAAWTAVGVRSSLRHLYPEGGFGQGGSLSVLVDPILTIVSVEKIAAAYADSPDEQMWRCYCPECGGRVLPWLLTGDPVQAGQHTFKLLLDRREGLVSLPPGSPRRESWRAKCTDAIWHYDALGLVDRHRWEPPGFLRAWQAA